MQNKTEMSMYYDIRQAEYFMIIYDCSLQIFIIKFSTLK